MTLTLTLALTFTLFTSAGSSNIIHSNQKQSPADTEIERQR
jgi:hypothetical protein